MARPRKPEGCRLSETLHLRVTEEEADMIYTGALRCGLSTSEFLRLGLRHIFEGASFRVNRDEQTQTRVKL